MTHNKHCMRCGLDFNSNHYRCPDCKSNAVQEKQPPPHLTEEQKSLIFGMLCDEVADMTLRDIVRTYIWPDTDKEIMEEFGHYLEDEEET